MTSSGDAEQLIPPSWMVKLVSAGSSQCFMETLCQMLCEIFKQDVTFFCSRRGQANTMVMCYGSEGNPFPTQVYPLAGSPCGLAYMQNRPVQCLEEAALAFPRDPQLREMGIESMFVYPFIFGNIGILSKRAGDLEVFHGVRKVLDLLKDRIRSETAGLLLSWQKDQLASFIFRCAFSTNFSEDMRLLSQHILQTEFFFDAALTFVHHKPLGKPPSHLEELIPEDEWFQIISCLISSPTRVSTDIDPDVLPVEEFRAIMAESANVPACGFSAVKDMLMDGTVDDRYLHLAPSQMPAQFQAFLDSNADSIVLPLAAFDDALSPVVKAHLIAFQKEMEGSGITTNPCVLCIRVEDIILMLMSCTHPDEKAAIATVQWARELCRVLRRRHRLACSQIADVQRSFHVTNYPVSSSAESSVNHSVQESFSSSSVYAAARNPIVRTLQQILKTLQDEYPSLQQPEFNQLYEVSDFTSLYIAAGDIFPDILQSILSSIMKANTRSSPANGDCCPITISVGALVQPSDTKDTKSVVVTVSADEVCWELIRDANQTFADMLDKSRITLHTERRDDKLAVIQFILPRIDVVTPAPRQRNVSVLLVRLSSVFVTCVNRFVSEYGWHIDHNITGEISDIIGKVTSRNRMLRPYDVVVIGFEDARRDAKIIRSILAHPRCSNMRIIHLIDSMGTAIPIANVTTCTPPHSLESFISTVDSALVDREVSSSRFRQRRTLRASNGFCSDIVI